AQEIDLVHLQLVIFRGIERNAMIDRQRNVPVVKKPHQVINVLEGGSASRNNDRLLGLGDFFDQHPVVQVGAGDLEDLDAEFAADIDRALVEGRGHGNTTGLADTFHQRGVFVEVELSVEGLLDVADVTPPTKVLVDEVPNVPDLQLHCRPDVIEAHDLAVRGDNLQTTF